MIIVTHAVAGATIATLVPSSPTTAFSLAFLSHYALDKIPHWDYKLNSKGKLTDFLILEKKSKISDLLKLSLDIFLAIALFTSLAVFLNISWWYVAMGAFFGALPDAFTFLINREPWNAVNRLHGKIHAQEIVNHVSGVFGQGVIMIALIFIAFWL